MSLKIYYVYLKAFKLDSFMLRKKKKVMFDCICCFYNMVPTSIFLLLTNKVVFDDLHISFDVILLEFRVLIWKILKFLY